MPLAVSVAISPGGGWMLATDITTIRSYSGIMRMAWEYNLPDPSQVIPSVAITDAGYVICGLLGSSKATGTTWGRQPSF